MNYRVIVSIRRCMFVNTGSTTLPSRSHKSSSAYEMSLACSRVHGRREGVNEKGRRESLEQDKMSHNPVLTRTRWIQHDTNLHSAIKWHSIFVSLRQVTSTKS